MHAMKKPRFLIAAFSYAETLQAAPYTACGSLYSPIKLHACGNPDGRIQELSKYQKILTSKCLGTRHSCYKAGAEIRPF
ncbi:MULTISPECIES: hypothetical protein [unclassified Pseudomonas]|uniref:hypothetical protein n=1 Tax=unclassified Pseudomonas TaxID=196821 RepID=UPI00385C7EA1